MVMFDHYQKEQLDNFRFQGAIHGAEFEDGEEKPLKKNKDSKGNEVFIFQDPASYNHLPKEERERLTNIMKRSHQAFASRVMKNG